MASTNIEWQPATRTHTTQKETHTMKHLQQLAAAASAALAFTLAPAVHAQATIDSATLDGMKTAQASAPSDLTDGEVRKIDLEAGKVTLKHADIKSLDMPAMTMVFAVKDKALLGKLKAGDKVQFKAINEGGKYTVTEMQAAR